MFGDLTDLVVKVLNSNLVLTYTDMQQHKHTYMNTQTERIGKSLEEEVLILLATACLNSGLKKDEDNCLYEDNKPTSPRPNINTYTYTYMYTHTHTHVCRHRVYIYIYTHSKQRHLYCFLLEFSSTSEIQKYNTIYHTSQCNCAASKVCFNPLL